MNIAEIGRRSKELAAKVPEDALVLMVVVLATSASFWLGMLYERDAGQGSDFSIEYAQQGTAVAQAVAPENARYVASKSGTKYHLPTCSGAKTISETNKVFFASKEDAEAAGYAPAANCKGI